MKVKILKLILCFAFFLLFTSQTVLAVNFFNGETQDIKLLRYGASRTVYYVIFWHPLGNIEFDRSMMFITPSLWEKVAGTWYRFHIPTNANKTPWLIKQKDNWLLDWNAPVEAVAELFDMAQAHYKTGEKIEQIHRLRPDFKALLYRNIRAIYNYDTIQYQTALNNGWLLKDANGQLVYSTTWTSNYLVDIGNSSYQKWVANWIKEKMEQYGFDGVMADESLKQGVGDAFWGVSAKPINPRTGNPWTDAEVRQACIETLTEIRNAIGSKMLVSNGIYTGQRFWSKQTEYMEYLSNPPFDGFASEGLWYQENGTWITEEEWKKSVDFLVFIQDNFLKVNPKRFYIAVCKTERVTGEIFPLPPDSSKEQLVTYAFTSTLLGVRNNQNYFYVPGNEGFIRRVVQPLHNIVLGVPINDYYLIAGTHVYARDFTQVKVLVNPTSDSYLIDLQGTFKTLNGEIITQITVKEHTGVILWRG